MPIQPYIPNIDEMEQDLEVAPEPGADIVMWAIPMPTYKALSDAAARKNMTVAELVSIALARAIEEG